MNLRSGVSATVWTYLLALLLVVFTAKASWAADSYRRNAPSDPAAGLGLAFVTYLNGDTLFNSEDTDEWAALSPNFTLRNGDRLWAGDGSRLEVRFTGVGNAWLNYESELDIVNLNRDERGGTFQVALVSGEASFAVKNFDTLNSVFQVDTQGASVRAYGRAGFRVAAISDGSTQVGVRDGYVEVETREGIIEVGDGEMIEVTPDGSYDIVSLPEDDDWDGWVASREERYEQTYVSSRYLPPDLDDYAYEFDDAGRWVSYPDYGYVWVPTVSVGWSPYSNGRWVWVAGDYVWLPYDPWYAPFHYGRWYFRASFGWFWVPPQPGIAFWSPGYVGWCWGPDYVYWVPLAPGEVYYGYGYYGPLSVNIAATKVVNVTNVYVNSRVTNAVVVVNKDNFLRGEARRVEIREKENPFINRGVGGTRLIARPPVAELKPVKETLIPKPDVRPSRKMLPPERLEQPAPFVRERAIAREKTESAFKPERRPAIIRGLERPEIPAGRGQEKGREIERRGAAPGTPEGGALRQPEKRPGRERALEQPGGEAPGFRETPRQRVEPERGPKREAPARIIRPEEPAIRVEPERPRTPEVQGGGTTVTPGFERKERPARPGRERTFEAPGIEAPRGPAREMQPQVAPEQPRINVPAREAPRVKAAPEQKATPEVAPETTAPAPAPEEGKAREKSKRGQRKGEEESVPGERQFKGR